jgi:hypothetical protein
VFTKKTLKLCYFNKTRLKGIVFLFFLFLSYGYLNGQVISVSGKVTDAGDGSALIGATVVVEGTTIGNITDINGEYIIDDVPARFINSFFLPWLCIE